MKILNITPDFTFLGEEKVIFVGDMHLGRFPKADEQLEYLLATLLPILDDKTILIFVGDQWDGGKAMETVMMCMVIDAFTKIHEKCLLAYFLIGNHDTVKLKEIKYNNTKLFSIFPKFNVVEYETVDIFGEKYDLMSYCHDYSKIREKILESGEVAIAVTHTDYYSFKLETGRDIEYGLKKEEMNKYKFVVNGHIHKEQHVDNIHNIGAPYQMKFSDRNTRKGIFIYKPKTDVLWFMENKISRKYFEMTETELLSETDVSYLNDSHLNIIDATDENIIFDKLMSIQPYYLDISLIDGTKVVMSVDGYVQPDDPDEELPSFLSDSKTVKLSDKTIILDEKVIKHVLQKAKDL